MPAPSVVPIEWKPASSGSEDFYRLSEVAAIEQLYKLSAADKAAMVPVIKIYKLPDPAAKGTDSKVLISSNLREPPAFGEAVGQFSDRPDASIDSVTVKTVNPRGWKLYREIDISLVVHKPDAVFGLGEPGQSTTVKEILDFNSELILEYGWSMTVDNVLTTGVPSSVTSRQTITPLPMPTTFIRFKVVTYNFQMTPTGELKFQIHAIENGELYTRNINIFDQHEYANENDVDKAAAAAINNAAIKMTNNIRKPMFTDKPGKPFRVNNLAGESDDMLRLSHVFNVLFSNIMAKIGQDNGFSQGEISLEFGTFNEWCPPTTAAYGRRKCAEANIGDFYIPLSTVTKIFGERTEKGLPMSVDAMMRSLVSVLNDQSIWDNSGAEKYDEKLQPPEIIVRTVYDSDRKEHRKMLVQVIDRKKYISFKTPSNYSVDGLRSVKEIIRRNLPAFLEENKMPKVTLYHQGSFIQTSNFQVTNDDQMKSIFIRRQMELAKKQRANGEPLSESMAPQPGPMQVIFRSAIKGDITMIGNFLFNMLGAYWLDFGIWAYDGIFYALQKVDKISRAGFTTTVSFQAEGSDPLGIGVLLSGDITDAMAGKIRDREKNQHDLAEKKRLGAERWARDQAAYEREYKDMVQMYKDKKINLASLNNGVRGVNEKYKGHKMRSGK